MPEKVNLDEALSRIPETWSPRIVAELNGQHVKLARLHGDFVWHRHEREDELFLVLSGSLRLEFRDRHVELEPGEMIVVPRGTDHRPVATDEVRVLLFEPAGTVNTGDAEDPRTIEQPEWLT